MTKRMIVMAIAFGLSLAGTQASASGDSTAPFVHIAEIEVDLSHLEAFKVLLVEEQDASVRREPGVLMLHSVALRDEPTHIQLLEVYADKSAYEAHLKSPQFLRYKTATEKMVSSLKLVETTPIALCAKVGVPTP